MTSMMSMMINHNMHDDDEAATATATMNRHLEKQQITTVQFIITGFGPFQNVPNNPTMVLVNSIVDYINEQKEKGLSLVAGSDHLDDIRIVHTAVVETSAEAARNEIDNISQQINNNDNNSTTNNANHNTVTVLLHLGVNYGGMQFELEQCAYNEATFRIPDERGYSPSKVGIVSCNNNTNKLLPIGQQLTTMLDIPDLVQKVREVENTMGTTNNDKPVKSNIAQVIGKDGSNYSNKNNNNHDDPNNNNNKSLVSLSTDPGLFVCNYIYCYSLGKFQCYTNDTTTAVTTTYNCINNNNSTKNNVRCLFLHVPPFTIIPKQQQLEMIVHVLIAIKKQIKER